MKRVDFVETEYGKFFNRLNTIDPTPRKQIVTFVEWCFKNGFLDNLTKQDLEDFYDGDFLPLLKNHKITIGFDFWTFDKGDYFIRVGIDPSKYFNKVSSSSILVRFPMSKRAEKRFYKLLNALLDTKSSISKIWFKDAGTCWYGSFYD